MKNLKKFIYLDHAAATPMAPEVLEAMLPYLKDKYYNPSANYTLAKEVSKDLAKARAKIAHWFGAKPTEIIFTAGGTEANNLAINGIMQQFPGGNIVVLAIEHEAILSPAGRYDCRLVPVDAKGIIDMAKLEKAIDDKTVLVSIMYANNEIGTVQPLHDIAETIKLKAKSRRAKGNNLSLYFHTDASQAPAYLDLHASRLGVDLMTINGGKIYGPKQTGVLYVKTGVKLQPQILGGGQERGLRSGTENVAGFIGLAEALDMVQSRRLAEVSRLQKLQQLFFDELTDKIPGIVVNGSLKKRLPNNVHVTIPGQDNERLIIKLDEQGVLCAAGSACSAANTEPSHVLGALGLDEASARASLRFTMGHSTTEVDIEKAVLALQESLST